jgi:alpha-amylase
MTQSVRFLLVLHNHQPVGNFDHVIEQAYQDSYLPFLDVFERYESLRIALHTSGPLMEWLDKHHGEYVDRLAALVAAGRIEIVGGAFYEPILTMLPSQDRIGQIEMYTRWLEARLGARINGIWTPERVWEQSLASDIAQAKIGYTLLDDFHFKNAGLTEERLHGYYVTEDDGHLLNVFPGSEALRYAIPFGPPQQTIDYLSSIAESQSNPVVVFADDGEKFGTWPETHQHVYDNGWLAQFFDLLVQNESWIHTSTPSDTLDQVAPSGKVYLPEGSYREMTEWALPAERLVEYEKIQHELQHDERGAAALPFVRGGFWRNFKVKYPETGEMYSRMMMVSERLQEAVDAGLEEGVTGPVVDRARRELYRGQCNCAYWHGAFGGVYLPHLRNAIYGHLIAADGALDEAFGKSGAWIEAAADDFNCDGRSEVHLVDDKLSVLLSPAQGGWLYELDVRSIQHNLLATLARRPEAYHQKVLAGPNQGDGEAASIHDRVVFKQDDLDQRVQYDPHLRKSLIDHFWDDDVTLEAIARCEAEERGDFVEGSYEAKVRRNPDRIQVQMTRSGRAFGLPLTITKGVTLEAGSSTLDVAYLIEGVPQDRPLHFAVELNFAGLPSGADDRFFYGQQRERLGQLGQKLDLADTSAIGLVDEWLGIDLALTTSRPSHIWAFPIETVSQSEGGFELVHQSVVVQPHWFIQGDQDGRWSVSMKLAVDTSLAESRNPQPAVAVTS